MLKQIIDHITETTWDMLSNIPCVKRLREHTWPAKLRGAYRQRSQITATENITYISSNLLLAIFSLELLWLLPNFLGMLLILVNLVFFNVLLWVSPMPCYFVNSFWQSNTLDILVNTQEMHCTQQMQQIHVQHQSLKYEKWRKPQKSLYNHSKCKITQGAFWCFEVFEV